MVIELTFFVAEARSFHSPLNPVLKSAYIPEIERIDYSHQQATTITLQMGPLLAIWNLYPEISIGVNKTRLGYGHYTCNSKDTSEFYFVSFSNICSL